MRPSQTFERPAASVMHNSTCRRFRTSLSAAVCSLLLAACADSTSAPSPIVSTGGEPRLGGIVNFPPTSFGNTPRRPDPEYFEVCKDYQDNAGNPVNTGPDVNITVTNAAGATGVVTLKAGECLDVYEGGGAGTTVTVTEQVPAGYSASWVRTQNGGGTSSTGAVVIFAPTSGTGNTVSGFVSGTGTITGTLVVFTNKALPASIGDRVWSDANGNGVQDPGESGLAGWTATIAGVNLPSGYTGTQLTGANGIYNFVNLPAGTYTVCVTPDAGFAQTYDLDGIATPNCAGRIVALGEIATDVDFGYQPPLGSIGNYVWNDVNGNGVQESGEPGLAGVAVTLSGAANTSTSTDATGAYLFSGLSAGSYTVTVAAPAGFVATPSAQGGNNATDSNGNPANVTLATNTSNDLTIDFGYFMTASVGDFVWNDLNANGVQDGGEPGIGGATVTLTGPSGPLSTTTDASGGYSFQKLVPGTYTVCTALPSGYSNTSLANQGNNAALDSDGSGTSNCATVTLAGGQTNNTIDFGFYKVGSLGDRVWNDANGNGVQDSGEAGLNGWTVTLRNLLNQVIGTATTSGNGAYSFGALLPGTYTVCVMAAPGYTQTYDLDGLGTPSCAAATLAAGQNRTDVDFGYRIPQATGSIGNYTWIDANGNGRQDAGEPVLNGVSLALAGTATASITSAGSGGYLFSGLSAGPYTVTATAPTGFTFTTTNAVGANSGNDSNGSPASVTLATNSSSDLTIDFGFVRLPGGGQGCTPGYWKQSQHFDSWRWYAITDMVDAVFNVTFRSVTKQNPTGPLTLLNAVDLKGNNDGEQLFRHGTAALLNAVYLSGVSTQYTAPQVIKMVRDAWLSGDATRIANTKNALETANERGCPLN